MSEELDKNMRRYLDAMLYELHDAKGYLIDADESLALVSEHFIRSGIDSLLLSNEERATQLAFSNAKETLRAFFEKALKLEKALREKGGAQ